MPISKMKKLIFILSLSMIIVMLGCSRERPGNHSEYADRQVHEVLLEAERLVEEHPDSAMVMIWKFYVFNFFYSIYAKQVTVCICTI